MRARLAAVPEDVRHRAGEALGEGLAELPAYRDCRRVVAFASLPDEIPSSGLVAAARRDGKRLVWPRVRGEELEFAEASPRELRPGAFGIAEPPPTSPATSLGAGDLVLLSGLAFDGEGFRLGRGRAYYDRALANGEARTAFRLAVGYAFQWCDRVPREPWDLPVDEGLCEEGRRAVRRVSR
jgi:5-formyltetrahydrofolate cyclo-ligase